MCDLSKTATAPSLRSYMLTQGNDMASTFPVKRSPPRDGQRYSSLTAGERCLDHCDCSIPNTVLLTVGSNQCHISDQQISCARPACHRMCVLRTLANASRMRFSSANRKRESDQGTATAKDGRWS
jgi:hypothetical protein